MNTTNRVTLRAPARERLLPGEIPTRTKMVPLRERVAPSVFDVYLSRSPFAQPYRSTTHRAKVAALVGDARAKFPGHDVNVVEKRPDGTCVEVAS